MITFFSIPKAFAGRADWIQRNAVGSWRELHPSAQVLLIGDDEGVDAAAADLGVEHVPATVRTTSGTPRIDAAFTEAHRHARHSLLCFVNADIILLDDFIAAVDRLAHIASPYLGVGESWDAAIEHPISFRGDWRSAVLDRTRDARKRGAGALDYFLFTESLYREMPPFAVGRVGFDNWLVWRAASDGAMVIDLTPSVRAIHQRHDYGHVAGGRQTTRSTGSEGRLNIELAGGKSHLYTRFDATHILGRRRLRPNLLRAFRLKENARKLLYKARTLTPWPPNDWSHAEQ